MAEPSENQPNAEAAPTVGPMLYILAAAFAAIAGFGAVTLGDHFSRQIPAPPERTAETRNTGGNLAAASTQDGKGGLSKLVRAEAPAALPEITFKDDKGETRSLAEWKGKVLLLNLWATWCAPCKVEMPSLDRLQAKLGGPDFAVLAVSLDRGGPDVPRKFLSAANLGNLLLLQDETAGLAGKVGAIGLPATLLLDRQGREIARLLGPAEWDSEHAVAVIREAIAGQRTQ